MDPNGLRGWQRALVAWFAVRGVLTLLTLLVALVFAATAHADGRAAAALQAASCHSGYVDAHLSWGVKCLRNGEFCKIGNSEYHRYGFDCPASGHLTSYTASSRRATPTAPVLPSVALGQTVRLGAGRRVRGCIRGDLPDRRCS